MESIKYKNHTINIVDDECPESPREWDNLGKMICFHSRYDLGDKHDINHDDYDGWDAMEKHLAKEYDGVILPLYLYDHSGITMNTTGFSCNWDSGQLGFICVSKESIRKWHSWKNITKKRLDTISKYLVNEVGTYDKYLTGEVYGFEVKDNKGDIVDSCYGFYNKEDAINDAKGCIS